MVPASELLDLSHDSMFWHISNSSCRPYITVPCNYPEKRLRKFPILSRCYLLAMDVNSMYEKIWGLRQRTRWKHGFGAVKMWKCIRREWKTLQDRCPQLLSDSFVRNRELNFVQLLCSFRAGPCDCSACMLYLQSCSMKWTAEWLLQSLDSDEFCSKSSASFQLWAQNEQ